MKKARLVIAALVFVLGAGLIAYPYVSDYVHRQEQHGVITIQEETVEETDDSALREELARSAFSQARPLLRIPLTPTRWA